MKYYGYETVKREDRGCCPGHDKVFVPAWNRNGRTCPTKVSAKRRPKKALRRRVREELRQYRTH